MAKKTKVVRAKVTRAKKPSPERRTTTRCRAFEVWSATDSGTMGYDDECSTAKEAREFISQCPAIIAPVIVEIDIPSMEY